MIYTTVDLRRLSQGDPLWAENNLLGLLTFVDGKPHCMTGRKDDQGQLVTFQLDDLEVYGTPPEERPDRCRIGIHTKVVHNAVRNIMKNELQVNPDFIRSALMDEARAKLNAVVDEVIQQAKRNYTSIAVGDLITSIVKKEVETVVGRISSDLKAEVRAKLTSELSGAIEHSIVDVLSNPLKVRIGGQTVKVSIAE